MRVGTALTLVAILAAPAAAQKNYKDLTYPQLADLKIPPIERIELANGLVLYLLEDHSLPTVSGYALIRTGGATGRTGRGTASQPREIHHWPKALGRQDRGGGSSSG